MKGKIKTYQSFQAIHSRFDRHFAPDSHVQINADADELTNRGRKNQTEKPDGKT